MILYPLIIQTCRRWRDLLLESAGSISAHCRLSSDHNMNTKINRGMIISSLLSSSSFSSLHTLRFVLSGHEVRWYIRGCIRKFLDWVINEVYAYNNKHSLRSNTNGYGSKTPYTDSQNSDTTVLSGTELYYLPFSLQAAGPETFGYTLVLHYNTFKRLQYLS
jgi:hypothetical protein